ncbi:MAG: AAA family ATPase, partial [Trueperella pyogenes]|nr:AAA family ATPase [Trueperella pyogenes]
MNNTPVRITVGSEFSGLPELSDHQRLLLKQITEGDVVLRGAPGSGKTTLLLAAVAELVRNDHSFLVLTPDRLRADQLMPAVQALAPNAVRPVRTPIGWAYSIVSQWRNTRDQPLGDVELLTGANMDRMLSQLLEETAIQWPEEFSDTIRSLPAFRMELRDLIDTAAESGTTAEHLEQFGRIRGMNQWVSLAPLLKKWNELPQLGVEFRGTMLAHGARLGRQAAQLLAHWDDRAHSAGVRIFAPIPQYLLIDDLQDCTPSLLALLHVAHQLGSRIIAFSNPDLSVTSYKRGYAHMDLDLARILDIQIEDCGAGYVGTPQLHALTLSLASRITQSGPAGRRNAAFAGDSERRLGEQGIFIHN